jgi:hypothetical protein
MAVTVKVNGWLAAAVPLALKLPEWMTVPAERATPLAALTTETVAAVPLATSTTPVIPVIVRAD